YTTLFRSEERQFRLAARAPLFVLSRALVVEPLEPAFRHVDLAPHLEASRRLAVERQGNAPDRPQVGGDVLADHAVAPGRSLHAAPVLVDEGDREAVDLWFADEGEVRAFGEGRGATVPGHELLLAEGIGKAEERLAVLDRLERGHRLAADPLSG